MGFRPLLAQVAPLTRFQLDFPAGHPPCAIGALPPVERSAPCISLELGFPGPYVGRIVALLRWACLLALSPGTKNLAG
jgi:hypothetical protein